MSRFLRIACITFLCFAWTAVKASRAELLVVSKPKIVRPEFTPKGDALPEVDGRLAKAWDAYEAKCAEVAMTLYSALGTEFDSACQSKDVQSLDLAERLDKLRDDIYRGDFVMLNDEEWPEAVVQALDATGASYLGALRDLENAYGNAVQAYKEAHKIRSARKLDVQIQEIACWLPACGVHAILRGRWIHNEYTYVFGDDHKVLEYKGPNTEKVHATGAWSIAPKTVPSRPAKLLNEHGRKWEIPEFSSQFTDSPRRPPSPPVAHVIVQLDNDWSAKVALLDRHSILVEPVQPNGTPILRYGEVVKNVYRRSCCEKPEANAK